MKRFIFSILCVAVFFIGLGALVEKTGAKFKSDEKALALIAKARQAIGGGAAVSNVKSLSIIGRTTRSLKIDGALRSEDGETEIALQFPDKMMKMSKIGIDNGKGEAGKTITKQMDVIVTGDKPGEMKVIVNDAGHSEGNGTGANTHIIIKKDGETVKDLTGEDAEKWIAEHGGNGDAAMKTTDGNGVNVERRVIVHPGDSAEGGKVMVGDGNHVMFNRIGHGEGHDRMRQNELLRTTLGLLLTAPAGMDINYTYAGDGDVDGTSCDIVVAEFGGSAYKLYLSKASSLPVMLSYKGMQEPQVFTFRTKASDGTENAKENMVFTRRVEGGPMAMADISVKYSDYRSVDGVQLPYKWMQTSAGDASETFDVISYEINPANIAEKFQGQKVMVRTAKPDNK